MRLSVSLGFSRFLSVSLGFSWFLSVSLGVSRCLSVSLQQTHGARGHDGNNGSGGRDGSRGSNGSRGRNGGNGGNGGHGTNGQSGSEGTEGQHGTSSRPLVYTVSANGGGYKVREICRIHGGGTQTRTFHYVTSSTDHTMNIQARITLGVEVIRACIFFIFLLMGNYNAE